MSTKIDGKPNIPIQQPRKNDQVYQAAKMYENQFLREMVKAMRATVTESELLPTSMGEKIYREQLDQEYVQGWSDRGGTGLADMIYDHIMDRYFNTRKRFEKPEAGGIPLEKAKGTIKPMSEGTKIELKSQQPNKPQAVIAPWGGNIRQIFEGGKSFAKIHHDNGLESQISYQGLATVAEGRVEAGRKIGLMEPGEGGLLWFVKSTI